MMENLREKKGLSKKKGNIFGGNFNFVEYKQDRKAGDRDDFWSKERNIRDFFSVLKKNFSLFVRNRYVLISYFMNFSNFQEPYSRERREIYDQKKSGNVTFSHEGVARTDRIYLSENLLSDELITTSFYIGEPSYDCMYIYLCRNFHFKITLDKMTTVLLKSARPRTKMTASLRRKSQLSVAIMCQVTSAPCPGCD